MSELVALVLSGGAGTRLWPLSRRARPKQFVDVLGEGRTLFRATLDRLDGLVPADRVYVVAPPDHAALVRAEAPTLPEANLVTEPYPRGNAAAIGLAVAVIARARPDAIVAVLPSDHVIEREAAFRDCLAAAARGAEAGYLVMLGITPARADTGFGYIERGDERVAPDVYRVRRFVEKPKADVAAKMFASGTHLWNAGMFVVTVERAL